jgi:hypothetical protein
MNRAKSFVLLTCLAATSASTLRAQNVVTDWNTVASATIVKNGGKPSGAGSVWFAYAAIATYDAVNVINRKFEPFYYFGQAPAGASAEAAAVAAAHRVLVNYFPAQQTTLDSQFAASIAAIQASDAAKASGILVGEASAAALIAVRANDGLEANVSYNPGNGPGVWQPTPPAFLPAATPWLGQMEPFTMSSAAQFLPAGPTPLDSRQWKWDCNLTRTLGEVDSTRRTASQTEIGLFWTEHTPQQYARAFGYLAANYNLSVQDTARLMAILWTGAADASIGCFNGKYQYSFWRPVTAIQAGGGNSDLPIDSDWLPLGTTPNHPEYPAQHGCISNAISHLIEGYFGTPQVHIVVDSLVFPDGTHTHVFEDTHDLFKEVFWARIYAGFHFSHSLKDGGELGSDVAHQLLRDHFRKLNEFKPAPASVADPVQ